MTDLEKVCKRCGVCCHGAVGVNLNGHFYKYWLRSWVCEFLDPKTNMCTVYADRFVKNPACQSLEVGLSEGSMSQDCAYVSLLKKDKGIQKRFMHKSAEVKLLKDLGADHFQNIKGVINLELLETMG